MGDQPTCKESAHILLVHGFSAPVNKTKPNHANQRNCFGCLVWVLGEEGAHMSHKRSLLLSQTKRGIVKTFFLCNESGCMVSSIACLTASKCQMGWCFGGDQIVCVLALEVTKMFGLQATRPLQAEWLCVAVRQTRACGLLPVCHHQRNGTTPRI